MAIVFGDEPVRQGRGPARPRRPQRRRGTGSRTSTSRPRCAATSPPRTSTATTAHVVATDTQKNTVYAFAQQYGVGEIEDFALRLGRHFVDAFDCGHRRQGHDRGVRLGPHRRTTRTRSPAPAAAPAPPSSPSTATTPGSCPGMTRSGRAQDDRLGIHRLPARPVHHAAPRTATASWRPRSPRGGATPTLDVDWAAAHADVRAHPARVLRRASTAWRCSRPCTSWANRCSRPIPRSPRSGCRCRTSTTSSSTSRRSGCPTTARSTTPPTALRPDRGHGDPRRRTRRRSGLADRPGVLLMGTTIVEGCAIATVDAADTEYASGHVVITDGWITAVGADPAPDVPDARSHRRHRLPRDSRPGQHPPPLLPMAHPRPGAAGTLFEWLVELYPVWARLDADLEHAAASAALAALALSGCTTRDGPPLRRAARRR